MILNDSEIKNITNIIQTFLDENSFDCMVQESTEFWYDEVDEMIFYAFAVTEKHDELFNNFNHELGLKYNCDNFILSLFHEIGHHETLHLIEPEERAFDEKVIDQIESKSELGIEDYSLYYRLTSEQIATQWAVDYINNNPEKVKALWDKVQPAILKFYEDNEIKP